MSTNVEGQSVSPNDAKPLVSSSQPEKDFVQWLTEDALPTTKDILAELRALNAKRDEAKQWLKDNNFELTEDAIQQRVNGCC